MPNKNKSLLSIFSIQNPLARIVYSSAPIASAFFIELTKQLSNPDEQKVLISALTTAGVVLAPVAGVAGNILADAIGENFFSRFSRKDILENGDLQKAVGDAICATILAIYDEEQSIFKQKQSGVFQKLKGYFQTEIRLEAKSISLNKDVLKKLSKVPTEIWKNLIEELENDKDTDLNLTVEEIEALYPKNLPDIFAIPAVEFNKITALDKNVWEKVLRKLCKLRGISTSNDDHPHFTDTIAHVAEVLVQNFPELLKHTLVTNIENDGKAYANLQLKIMGETLFFARENNKTNAEISAKIDRLIERTQQIDDLYSSKVFDFTDKFWNRAFDLQSDLKDIASETLDLTKKIDTTTLETNEFVKKIYELVLIQPKPLPKHIAHDSFPAHTNYFTGRDDVIGKIVETLDKHQKATLHGISGLGKTSVALEFAKRFEDSYTNIIFVRATRNDAVGNFARLAETIDETAKTLENDTARARILTNWLEDNGDWLLIIDNVDAPHEVLPLLPVKPRGHILSTGNTPTITVLGNEVEIKKMAAENGALLLYRRAKTLEGVNDDEIETALQNETGAEQTAVRNLVEEFDGLPLALNLAGAYIHRFDKKFAQYENLYRTKAHQLLAEQDINSDYQNDSVALAFSLAFDEIGTPENDTDEAREIADTAVLFVKTAAFLFPEAMPFEIFNNVLKNQTERGAELSVDEMFLDKVFGKIARFDLFEKDADRQTFDIHRLVQLVVFNKIEPDEKTALGSQILEILKGLFPLYDYYNKQDCERFFRQTETVLANADKMNLQNEISMSLYYRTGRYQELLGNFAQAERFYTRHLETSKAVFGENDKETAASLNNLALVYRSQGRYDEAVELYQQALLIDEKTIGKEHPYYAIRLGNLSKVYDAQGDFRYAEQNNLQALEIFENSVGKLHPYYATCLTDLALVYYSQNKYDEAIELYQKALLIDEKTIGKEHPNYAFGLNNLGLVYHSQGRYDEALPMFEEALRIIIKFLGENHPDTQTVRENLESCRTEKGI